MPAYTPDPEQDQRLEVAMGNMLRIGVLLAAAVVLLGGLLYLRHPGAPVPNYRAFHAGAAHTRTFPGILRGLSAWKSASIIQCGILLLILTPVGRVVFALVGFARERDWLYTLVSGIVLAVLVYSLLHIR